MSILKSATKGVAKRVMHFGFSHHCPVCSSRVRQFFKYQGPPPRLEPNPPTECPVCASHNRHRMIRLWLQRRTDLMDGKNKKVLHFAPEPRLSRLLKTFPYLDYTSADLTLEAAMVRMDITAIEFPNDTFDVILCSHVLEHIPDDRKAMSELFRVLKPGGWAWLQVPITAESICEDPSVTDPLERERLFGQFDHVRRYGMDYRGRLEDAGFEVHPYEVLKEFSEDEVRRYGLLSDEDRVIWYCRKPAPTA